QGQVVARQETVRIEPQVAQAQAGVLQAKGLVAQAQAQVAGYQSLVEKLHNGSRPEEIAQARANVHAVKAKVERARQQLERNNKLFATSGGKMPTPQVLEDLTAAEKVAVAKLDAA